MIITILTLFPEVFPSIFSSSIIDRAQKLKLVEIRLVNIRDFAPDKHHQVDDKQYGGGVGMVVRVDVIEKAIQSAKFRPKADRPMDEKVPFGKVQDKQSLKLKEKIVLLDPKGKQFNQKTARSFAKLTHLILVCGHYEGVDERISNFIDEKISIGEYILTGGEIPAMVIADATIRLLKGVLIKKEATINESFTKEKELEPPQYTRPKIYKSYEVPPVLLSGNHQKIKEWRKNHKMLLK